MLQSVNMPLFLHFLEKPQMLIYKVYLKKKKLTWNVHESVVKSQDEFIGSHKNTCDTFCGNFSCFCYNLQLPLAVAFRFVYTKFSLPMHWTHLHDWYVHAHTRFGKKGAILSILFLSRESTQRKMLLNII